MTGTNCGIRHRARLMALAALAALPLAAGCRQKMAEQPYYRPLEHSDFFPDGRSARPLQSGVIHRSQHLESDPLVTGLTAEEWGRAYQYGVPPKPDAPAPNDAELVKRQIGAPRYDQRVAGQPKVFVTEFPFEITQDDLRRGQERFTVYCAVCHGPLGNGQGKIWERGYLVPTSFHTQKVSPTEATVTNPQGLGVSRGYSIWNIQMPMYDAPVGYYFEVITKGYGGMPSYSAQIEPADRWRIIAYVRSLQLSQMKTLPEAGAKK